MFTNWYSSNKATVLGWFQDLHAHPETGFEEVRTSSFVADRLSDFGLDVATGIGGTGVVGTLYGKGANSENPGRCIGIRAELDALPMQERADVKYRSKTEGRFHGCGHDGHTVTALTAAAYLSENRSFEGTARFIFQPAEELLTGANAMLRDGLFDRFPCDEIYALHNLPGLPVGSVSVPARAALASADEINVRITANGTHGSAPHTGEDAILAASAYITSVQQISTRVTDAREASVISFGKISGGTARNILPELVEIEGTLRTNSMEARSRLAKLLTDTAQAIGLAHGVRISAEVTPIAPVAMNDAAAAAAVVASAKRVVGPDQVFENARSQMASEDFAEMQARVPGAYFFIGQTGRYPHHPEYIFDTNIIPIGAEIYADLVKSRCNPQLSSFQAA